MEINEKLMNNLISAIDWDRVKHSDTFSSEADGEVTSYIDIDTFDCENGISKLVLIPRVISHFVIKIPYRVIWDGDEYDEENDEYGLYREFSQAPFSGWDYCASEWMYYCLAKKHHLENFFPKTILYKENPYPIYCQEKCLPFYKVQTHTKSKEYAEAKARELSTTMPKELKRNFYTLDKNWITDAIDWYGEDQLFKLLRFLADYNITDLHRSNYGYLEETLRPVLIDFSGFYD